MRNLIVLKHDLNVGTTHISLPENAEIVFFGIQDSCFKMWVVHDSCNNIYFKNYTFYIAGTCEFIQGDAKHIQSIIDGEYVWHLFEILNP